MPNISTGETVTVGEMRQWLDGCSDEMKIYANIVGDVACSNITSISVGRYRGLARDGYQEEPWFLDLGVSR